MTDLPDNTVMPFEIKPLGVRGRIVRLGGVVDDILHKHDYPAPVSALLAEAVALTAMLGASLKFDGKFILQTNSDGPVDLLVADFSSPGGIRGYARFDAGAVARLKTPTPQALLGKGHLAMTIDQGQGMERYQGIVTLGGVTLTEAALGYFQQSEQIPTRLRLAANPLAKISTHGIRAWTRTPSEPPEAVANPSRPAPIANQGSNPSTSDPSSIPPAVSFRPSARETHGSLHRTSRT